ncbi:MAG TPA: HEPN domain-containing protein [Hanamia sp.]
MKKNDDYIKYKVHKAAQSIKEAKLLMENGLNDTAMSRLYYAAFYSVNALLAFHGFNPKTHSGTKSIFNKEFILPGKIEGRFSDFYSFLMAKRFEADYDDFVYINEDNIQSSIAETEEFVSMINGLIKML